MLKSGSSANEALSMDGQHLLSPIDEELHEDTARYDMLYAERVEIFKRFKAATSPLQSHSEMAAKMLSILRTFEYDIDEPILIPQPKIKYLVIEGGGVKGIVYPGSFTAFEEYGCWNDIEYIAGTSAGALSALLVGLGFTSMQIRQIIKNLNFVDFQDSSGWGFLSALKKGAYYEGIAMYNWISSIITQVLGSSEVTFRDFEEKRKTDPSLKGIIVYATNYDDPKHPQQAFSFLDTPDCRIADCVYASAAYPGAFKQRTIYEKKEGKFVPIPGSFADGGIVVNWPIDAFNRKNFCDPQYDFIERIKDSQAKIINPHTVGLSLKDLQSLDDAITPLSDTLRQLQAHSPQPTSASEKSSLLPIPRTIINLGRAIVWGYWGVRQPQDVDAQQKELYHDRTIQICNLGVPTLDFTLTPRTSDALVESGLNASRLWLRKFQNPASDYPKYLYDDRLTIDEEALKQNNPDGFIFHKAREYLIEFISEMEKQRKYELDYIKLIDQQYQRGDINDFSIYRNVRLRFAANKILQLFQSKMHQQEFSIIEKTMLAACEMYYEKKKDIENSQKRRWQYVTDDNIVNLIADKMHTAPNDVMPLVCGQLSRIIVLAQLPIQNNDNLIGRVVKTGNVALVRDFFDHLSNALKKSHSQSKLEPEHADSHAAFLHLLNDVASPPVLYSALNLNDENAMLKTLLDYGVDPCAPCLEAHSPIIQSIQQNHYSTFQCLIAALRMPLYQVEINQDSILHHIIQHAKKNFVRNLLKDNKIRDLIKNSNFDKQNRQHYTPAELATVLSTTDANYRWKLIFSLNPYYFNRFNDTKKVATEKQKKAAVFQKKKASILSELKDYKSSIIDAFDATLCLQILASPIQDTVENQLCELARQPEKNALFVAFCKKIISQPALRDSLLQLLNARHEGKTIFYIACLHNNIPFVNYFLKIYPAINMEHAGPPAEPNVLIAVARQGYYELLSILVNTMRMHQSDGFVFDETHEINAKLFSLDLEEASYASRKINNICLYMIIKNNRTDILTALIATAKKQHDKLDYLFQWIEPFTAPDDIPVHYPELEYAHQCRPHLYKMLISHMSEPCKAERINKIVKYNISRTQQHVRATQSMQLCPPLYTPAPAPFVPLWKSLPCISSLTLSDSPPQTTESNSPPITQHSDKHDSSQSDDAADVSEDGVEGVDEKIKILTLE